MIVPKRGNMVDGIENVIVSLYAKGMSNSDIEEQIQEVYNFDVSTSTISRITEKVAGDIVAWQNRPLEPIYLIVWMPARAVRTGTVWYSRCARVPKWSTRPFTWP
jgi:transposase-like protein